MSIDDDNETVIFRWLDSSCPGDCYFGPLYDHKIESRERKNFYTRDELLDSGWPESIKKRIRTAKEGTIIRINHIHRDGYLCIQRLTKDELGQIRKYSQLKNLLSEVREEISKHIPGELKEKEAGIVKEMRTYQNRKGRKYENQKWLCQQFQ